MIPYGKQSVEEDDIAAVLEVLRSNWLTTGPKIQEFEKAFAEYVGTKQAIAVCNGTAALHTAMFALDIQPGDEVILPAMTFTATANSVVFQGGIPIFTDVHSDTLLLDADKVQSKISPSTKVIIGVDYAGQPCDYDALQSIADDHNITLIADACHSIGGRYKGRNVGSLAKLNTFSFHPVKHITTGEGGMITTDDDELAKRMRLFRNHGITTDHRQREAAGSWFYEMVELGHNYRITDIQCALGMSQLKKLAGWVARRQEIARCYDSAFADLSAIEPLKVMENLNHAYHLYVVRLNLEKLKGSREEIYTALRAEGIGVNVHYIPVHLHPFYRKRFNTKPGMCPVAEAAYDRVLSLPLFHGMTDQNIHEVTRVVKEIVYAYHA